MASMSNYLENKILDHIFRATSYSQPSTIAIALCTAAPSDSSTGSTITEVSGGSYARVDLSAPANATWNGTHGNTTGASSGTDGTIENASTITFPTASADWGTVTHVAICDATTNGNLLFYGALTVSKVVSNGDTFTFQASQLSIQIDG